jgi:hypothetical protein
MREATRRMMPPRPKPDLLGHKRYAAAHHGRLPDRSCHARFAVDVIGALARTLHLTLDDALLSLRYDLGDELVVLEVDGRWLVWRTAGRLAADPSRENFVASIVNLAR